MESLPAILSNSNYLALGRREYYGPICCKLERCGSKNQIIKSYQFLTEN